MNDPLSKEGMLYIVATPIGNLADMTHRGLQVLAQVDVILAEDTRHSRHLLNHYGISNQLRSYHEHNEEQRIASILDDLAAGKSLALISDAGTPLINDPGFVLVRAVREQGYAIEAVPGASSIIAALSVAGLPTDRFVYDGFLPAKSAARQSQLKRYLAQTRTIVLLESSHRIAASLQDILIVLGPERKMVIARELTKKFATVLNGTIAHLIETLEQDPNQLRGEFVLLIEGATETEPEQAEVGHILRTLLSELPIKQAATLTAKLTNKRKNDVYKMALELKQQGE